MFTRETVVAIYDGFEKAKSGLKSLLDEGFLQMDVSFAVSNPNNDYTNLDFRFKPFDAVIHEVKDSDNLIDNLAGSTFAMTSVVVPDVGAVMAAGLLADLLSGKTRATIGGLADSLTHLAIPYQDARYYAEAVYRGHTLLAVHVKTQEAMGVAMDILNHNAPCNLKALADEWTDFDSRVEPYAYRKFIAAANDFSIMHERYRATYEVIIHYPDANTLLNSDLNHRAM